MLTQTAIRNVSQRRETGDEHTSSAEAITDCKIIVIKRSTVVALAARDNDVARQMWALTARELQRVQAHSLVLIKSAEGRVAGFLLERADRVLSGGTVELPMSRQDIADYLGLTIETVSRTLKHLEDAAAIEVPKRRHSDWPTVAHIQAAIDHFTQRITR
jgi:CRP/FNR family nitrogen fixation transcriptional regulator